VDDPVDPLDGLQLLFKAALGGLFDILVKVIRQHYLVPAFKPAVAGFKGFAFELSLTVGRAHGYVNALQHVRKYSGGQGFAIDQYAVAVKDD
jgi:hypothetical protein